MTVIEGAWRQSPDWGPWSRQIRATHLDLSCSVCGFAGPLLQCFGTSVAPARTGRRVVSPSRIADGKRLKSVPHHYPAHPVRTHYAVCCQACGDQVVYLMDTPQWRELDEAEVVPPPAPRTARCCNHDCARTYAPE
jgi:hypothetical protein